MVSFKKKKETLSLCAQQRLLVENPRDTSLLVSANQWSSLLFGSRQHTKSQRQELASSMRVTAGNVQSAADSANCLMPANTKVLCIEGAAKHICNTLTMTC